MSRRLLFPLLAALAFVCAAAPGASAAPPAHGTPPAQAAHAAHSADVSSVRAVNALNEGDTDEASCPDEFWVEDEDGAYCDDESWLDEEDDLALCDDEWLDDDEWSDDEEWLDDEAWLEDEDDDGGAGSGADDEEDEDACAEEVVAPRISDLDATVVGKGRKQRVRISFRLDRAGELELTLSRTAPGATTRCADSAAKRKGKDRGDRKRNGDKRCARTTSLRGALSVDGDRGRNTVMLPRRWSGRALAAGTYRVTLTPLDEGGESATTSFTLASASRAAKR